MHHTVIVILLLLLNCYHHPRPFTIMHLKCHVVNMGETVDGLLKST